MSETSRSAPAGWYPDQTAAGTIRYWDGRAWTDHRAHAQTLERDFWSRYRHRYSRTAGVLGGLGAVVGFFSHVSDAVPAGGSYAYALGQEIGGAIVFGAAGFVLALLVNLAVAKIPPT